MSSVLDRLLARSGKTRAGLHARSRTASALRRRGVEDSAELRRILGLPRRSSAEIPDLSSVLRLPGSTGRLREAQNLALADLDEVGLVAPMPVGSGKTLITLLSAYVLAINPSRALLLVPAALRERTRRSAKEYAKDWPVVLPELLGYEELGRPDRADAIDALSPDLIIADEAHYLRNRNAARTRRVERYLQAHPQCRFVPLSGTLDSGSLLDCAHLYRWALGDRSPLPADSDAVTWSKALDAERWDHGQRLAPGALGAFAESPDEDVGAAYSRFVKASPGVVSVHTEECPASLTISRWRPPMDARIGEMIRTVERDHVRPDGEPLTPADECRLVCQLLFRFWYRWDPLPPLEWLAARREWARFAREWTGFEGAPYDSEGQVKLAFPDRYAVWRAVEKTYTPRTVYEWEGTEAIDAVREWAGDDGIVWTSFRAVHEKLKLPYYSSHGLNAQGKHIEHARGPILASVKSCGKGQHLVQYDRAMIMTLPATNEPCEQLLGRHHRSGQKSDDVQVAIATGIEYLENVIRRVRSEADRISTRDGKPQKLTLATWT